MNIFNLSACVPRKRYPRCTDVLTRTRLGVRVGALLALRVNAVVWKHNIYSLLICFSVFIGLRECSSVPTTAAPLPSSLPLPAAHSLLPRSRPHTGPAGDTIKKKKKGHVQRLESWYRRRVKVSVADIYPPWEQQRPCLSCADKTVLTCTIRLHCFALLNQFPQCAPTRKKGISSKQCAISLPVSLKQTVPIMWGLQY